MRSAWDRVDCPRTNLPGAIRLQRDADALLGAFLPASRMHLQSKAAHLGPDFDSCDRLSSRSFLQSALLWNHQTGPPPRFVGPLDGRSQGQFWR